MKNIKVSMVSLGCNKNQVDGEIMLRSLMDAGYEIISDAGLSDIVIINTCGFIQSAKEEAIENILEFCTLKEEGRIKKVIITGCLAERYREEVLKEIPEADAVIGIGSNKDIVSLIEKTLEGEKVLSFGEKIDLPLSGDRVLTNPPHYAYIKIAEGCSNNCTYCAIPMIRGPFRSRKMEDILKEAEYFANEGISEINIIAQDTTRYGEDIYGKPSLDILLKNLAKIEKVKWIRVLYAYPERITDSLIDVLASEEKIVKYIDIPLQHASDSVLKRMNRKGTGEGYKALIEKLRAKIPDITIRTTMIAGFPGETEKDFSALCEFVKEMKFDRLGCFSYSEEEGTPAALLTPQIDEEIREKRAEIITFEQQMIMENIASSRVGKIYKVLLEGYDRYAGVFIGRSQMDAPDIDPKVFFTSENKNLSIGNFYNVLITDTEGIDLLGEICD